MLAKTYEMLKKGEMIGSDQIILPTDVMRQELLEGTM
jgi:hypothetical protein